MLMRATTGAMWTARELRARGKQVEATCKVCGELYDCVWHRVWECSQRSGLRSQVFAADTIAAAIATGSEDLRFARGLFATPVCGGEHEAVARGHGVRMQSTRRGGGR